MPLQATSGAASYDAFGGGVPVEPVYIEQIFSTYLYTGNGNTAPETQTINNGIDLSTKGGLVWIKNRTVATNNVLFDTNRGATKVLVSNATSAEATDASTLTSFNNNGFSVYYGQGVNGQNNPIASWTFRKQPKFFDVVTWTADDSGTGQAVPHNLGSIPGCIIVKATSASSNWFTWHIASGITVARSGFQLNSTAASALSVNSTGQMTSTEFFSGQLFDSSFGRPVTDGTTYVAYLFAHNAGGFGLTGTDNVISCGSFTSSAGGLATVNLGYEPQWLMFKGSNGVTHWQMVDNMRGFVVGAANTGTSYLNANSSAAEGTNPPVGITNTGFNFDGAPNITYIYIAIRRGPMKVPTLGTSVFSPVNQAGGGTVTTNFPVDLNINTAKSLTIDKYAFSRLTGPANYLNTNLTAAETAGGANFILFDRQNSIKDDFWGSGNSIIYWNFRRAPSFFDEVCYTGTGTSLTLNHNLGASPELVISKRRSGVYDWTVYSSARGTSNTLFLNLTNAETAYTSVSAATATTFTVEGVASASGETFVAYLFATCAGVSKVGSYTGTATTKQIDCGFTAGARFVLIKRTDSTGDWYVWDSARGIVSGNDPYLLLNSTAAEVTSTDYIDTYSAGFELSSTAPAAINASGGTFIFLAIA